MNAMPGSSSASTGAIVGACIGAFVIGTIALCVSHHKGSNRRKATSPSIYMIHSDEPEIVMPMDVIPTPPDSVHSPTGERSAGNSVKLASVFDRYPYNEFEGTLL